MRRSRLVTVGLVVGLAGCGGSPSATSSAAAPQRRSAPPTATANATLGADGAWIAYQGRAAGGGYGVLLVRPDGSDSHWPMSGVGGKFQEHPDWSPDGRRLTFSVTDTDDSEDIWVADIDGSNAERIVDCQAPCAWADEPAWSPDGTSIVFQRTVLKDARRTSTIERWDVLARTVRILATAPDGRTFYAPRWAPDGRTLVAEYATNGKALDDPPIENTIVVIDLAATVPTMRELTDRTLLANNPDWSPGGDLIVFSLPALNAGFDGPADLYTIAPTGGPMRRITTLAESSRRAIQPTFTPDGSSVLFVLEASPGSEIGMASVPTSGGDPRSATSSGYLDGVHPRLRPAP